MNGTKKRGPKDPITDEHKKAMSIGRVEGRAVRDYLEAIKAYQATLKPGRKRTIPKIEEQIAQCDAIIADPASNPVDELLAHQGKIDLIKEMETLVNRVNPKDFEDAFVKVAKAYSDRKGITYAAWRAVGVEPAVLKKAGIKRG